MIRVSNLNHNNELYEVISFENNEKGNPIYSIINNGESGYEKADYDYSENTCSIFRYNTKNEIIKTQNSITIDKNLPSSKYLYNEFGDVLDYERCQYEYEYDTYGNWIKKTVFEKDGKRLRKNALIVRRITYHE